ncbi:MAG: methyltransferase [Kiritimatiellaeota bacterium]|nr:methyltransferase [Kiritimatiellota bacterium]
MTSRELVQRTLRFESPERLPRQLWSLPWAQRHLASAIAEIQSRWPDDIVGAPWVYEPSSVSAGDMYGVGQYVDPWGCTFTNIHWGVIGEVKQPLVTELNQWRDKVKPPYETLPKDANAARQKVNAFCAATDKFVFAGCNPRPWEQYQFLRGTENALVDVAEDDPESQAMLQRMQEFYVKDVEFWASTDVDAISFMDDWGSQLALLISPAAWRKWFKPLYRQYAEIAHRHGKFIFMHSDGYTAEIIPDLIEIGIDALNTQIFCMDMAELAAIAKGKITFWGEIDRQNVMASTNPEVGREAVRKVARHLYDPRGGLIIEFELSAGSHGATALAIYDEWHAFQATAWR